MGMNADGGVNEFIFRCECDAAIQRAWTGSAADGHDCLNTRVPRPRKHLLAVRIELFHFEVGVGVNEHDGILLSFLAGRIFDGSEISVLLTSTSCPPAHLPENCITPACLPQPRPRQSFHSIPTRATFLAQDWRRSQLCGRSASLARMPPQCLLLPAALRCRDRLPG